jgi:hypothetical protein
MTLNPSNVNVTTVGNASLTTAQILAGIITRSGPSGGFTDTLPATSAILAALGNSATPWIVKYINASGQTATLAAGDANTTISDGAGMLGATTIATHQECEILFTPKGTASQSPSLTVTLLSRHTLV